MLVLHGGGGLVAHPRDFAAWLATQGYVALAPDYFSPLGVTRQTFDGQTFFVQYTDRAREHQGHGLECLKSLPYVDKQRVGVVGFSLGGYFAVVLAVRDDVKAVVSYYGATHGTPVSARPTKYTWGDVVAQVRAPVLMLHGEADTTAPISQASATHRLLLERGKQAELVTYPGAEHSFDQLRSPFYDARVTADAQARTLAFLAARLK
jgi:carboxymethylenebutenolidase